MIPYAREAGAILLLAAIGGWSWLVYDYGHGNAMIESADKLAAANKRAESVIAEYAKAEADAVERTRKAEQATATAVAEALDEADKRNDQIEVDYQRRIAGVAADRDRLQKLWRAERATDRLAGDSEAARQAAEQDGLRRESAARIVRAVERVQSERDEVIDRYLALGTGGD